MFKLAASLLFLTASTCFLVLSQSKGGVLTGERYFDRNGSVWQTNLHQDFELDSLGKIIRRVDYAYEGVLTSTKTWACTYTYTSYTLRFTDSDYDEWNKIYWSLDQRYSYDLSGNLLSFSDCYSWTTPNESEIENYYMNYSYSENRITNISSYVERTLGIYDYTLKEFVYDEMGRITQETTKTCLDIEATPQVWINKERTLWTWNGNEGIGINNIYQNSVWINKERTIRILNEQLKPVTEYSSYWSSGNWIDQYEYVMQYVNEGVINRHYTNIYNPNTKGYDLYKLHNYYYENFDGMSAPGNLITTIADGQITLNWYAVTGSSGYKVYSSDDPYDNFTEDTSGTFDGVYWTAPISDSKKFYKVTAIDSSK